MSAWFGYRPWMSTGRIIATLKPILATRWSSLTAETVRCTGTMAAGKRRVGSAEAQSQIWSL